jgi:toxin ParE1/3/4
VKPIVIHSEARAELDDAMAFYESRASGLGLDLLAKVEDAVAKIQQSPEAWPPHRHSGFRNYFTERFPFTVYYMELNDCIWLAAIAHGSRRPDYWKTRRFET